MGIILQRVTVLSVRKNLFASLPNIQVTKIRIAQKKNIVECYSIVDW